MKSTQYMLGLSHAYASVIIHEETLQNHSQNSNVCGPAICDTHALHLAIPLAQVVMSLTVVIIIIMATESTRKTLRCCRAMKSNKWRTVEQTEDPPDVSGHIWYAAPRVQCPVCSSFLNAASAKHARICTRLGLPASRAGNAFYTKDFGCACIRLVNVFNRLACIIFRGMSPALQR